MMRQGSTGASRGPSLCDHKLVGSSAARHRLDGTPKGPSLDRWMPDSSLLTSSCKTDGEDY